MLGTKLVPISVYERRISEQAMVTLRGTCAGIRSRISRDNTSKAAIFQGIALAKSFCSRNTVRGALETLRKEQLIKKVQGKGIMLMKSALKIRKICEYVVLSYNTPTLSQFLLVMLHELEDQAKMMNAELVYMTLPGDSEEDIMLVQRRIRKRNKPFGIVLVGRYTCPLLEKLREALPGLVLIGDVYGTNSRPAKRLFRRWLETTTIKYQAVNLLLERGFSKIGVIGVIGRNLGKAFYEGCRAAFADHNKKFLEQYLFWAIKTRKKPRTASSKC